MNIRVVFMIVLVLLLVGTISSLEKHTFDMGEGYLSRIESNNSNFTGFNYNEEFLPSCLLNDTLLNIDLAEGESFVIESKVISLNVEDYVLYNYFLYLIKEKENLVILYSTSEVLEEVSSFAEFFNLASEEDNSLTNYSFLILAKGSEVFSSSFQEETLNSSFSLIFDPESLQVQGLFHGVNKEDLANASQVFLNKSDYFSSFGACDVILGEKTAPSEIPVSDSLLSNLRAWVSDTEDGFFESLMNIINIFKE